MSTLIYHNGQLQYSHKEFPVKPDCIGKWTHDKSVLDQQRDYYGKEKSFHASLLPVVNPEVIPGLLMSDQLNKLVKLMPSFGYEHFNEGDHWDVPDGVEVKLCQTLTGSAVRLSIKATI